jgi:hypothetical protein
MISIIWTNFYINLHWSELKCSANQLSNKPSMRINLEQISMKCNEKRVNCYIRNYGVQINNLFHNNVSS